MPMLRTFDSSELIDWLLYHIAAQQAGVIPHPCSDEFWLVCAGLPSSVRLCFGQPCSPTRNGRFARPCDRSTYTYMPSGRSPARLVSFSRVPPGVGPKQSRAGHSRELGKRHMRSSLASGKSATPPARCIHRPLHDTSSAGYRLLVSRASCGASREPESRFSPALIPRTCAVSPTFRQGAFFFVASTLADLSSARLTTCTRNHTSIRRKSDTRRL